MKERIVARIAKELQDGDVVNLGIGMPTMVAGHVDKGIKIHLQSENGIINMGKVVSDDEIDPHIVNAGAQHVDVEPDAMFFDSAFSFGLIRGGHVDVTVLGALQVDEEGSLASHIIPGKMVPGMGGAMDLVSGSKKVIIATTHTAKDGSSKILKKITLPATAVRKVHMIVTEMAVMEVTKDGLLLKEVADGVSVEDVVKATEAKLIVPKNVGVF